MVCWPAPSSGGLFFMDVAAAHQLSPAEADSNMRDMYFHVAGTCVACPSVLVSTAVAPSY